MTGYHIPDHLTEEVQAFLFMNAARRVNPIFPVPPMLALGGPPGSGKTTGVKETCARLDVHLDVLPSSILGGVYAGQSSITLRDTIKRASQSEKWMSAILIDDLDMSEARVDDALSNTVSSPLLNGTLMAYADNPFELKTHDDPTEKEAETLALERPPVIFITCNDLSKLYGPLRRNMRMVHVEHDPRGQDAVAIVQAMYPRTHPADIKKLVEAYPDASIAFFRSLGMAVAKTHAKRFARSIKTRLFNPDFARLARDLEAAATGASFEELATAAQALSLTDDGKNHLKSVA
ncbi:AAA family ATPase [uncultured Tateyamaria sp.]|uniref:AAA family ATPase n=1 Tax=uncultured Tateyamaria sp. TaxID=455651 RepID=UPI00261F8FB1|nr:AAA family ATPase [uncultured Tateyamaria sp.]